jgi:hypothetical protein
VELEPQTVWLVVPRVHANQVAVVEQAVQVLERMAESESTLTLLPQAPM